MPTTIDIADAVVFELNQSGLTPTFTAERKLLPKHTTEALSELKVTVVPKSAEMSRLNRSQVGVEVEIDVCVQQRLSDIDTEGPELIELVENLIDYMATRSLSQAPGVQWVRTRNDPVYALDHLAENRLFTSVITLTYMLAR